MIRSNRRTRIIGCAVLAVVACTAALALRFTGGSKAANSGLVKVVRHGNPGLTSEPREAVRDRSFDDYRIVAERNVFQPLVSPPQENVALSVPAEMPSATGEARTPPRLPGRPSPTADLAMTGVVESDGGLMALIKNIRTGASAYAGIGEDAFGLRVASIEARRVALARGDETYMLAMGEKDIPEGGAEPETSGGAASTATGAEAGQRPRPGFGRPPGSGFGGMSREEMMRRMRERGLSGDARRRGPGGGAGGGRGPGGRRDSGGGRGPGGGRGGAPRGG